MTSINGKILLTFSSLANLHAKLCTNDFEIFPNIPPQ